MAEGEESAPEQAGGSTPPPGLGVPGLGVPAPSTPPVQAGAGPETPPLAPGQPEIVEDYYPTFDPRATYRAPPPPRRTSRHGISRIILAGILLLAALGWVVTQVRHARATPADKKACSSTLTAFSNPTAALPTMLRDLDFADDKTLLGARGDMQAHLAQRNVQGFSDDLNKVIRRCNQLSSEFKSGFKSFCDTHPGYCKETFQIGPF